MAFAGDDSEHVGFDLRAAIWRACPASFDLVCRSSDPSPWLSRLVPFGATRARRWLVNSYADWDHTVRAFSTA